MTPDGTRMSAPTRGGPSGSGRLEPNRRGHRSPEPMPLAPMLVLFGALALAGCGRAREPQLFERLPPERSGVTFVKDRKSTRLNSSHSQISYAVFCLKKKKTTQREPTTPARDITAHGVAPERTAY